MKRLETEHFLTLGLIETGLNRAYERLKKDLIVIESNKTQLDIFNIYSSISEVLLWINVNNEWHFINNRGLYSSKDNKVKHGAGETLGLRHAFNLLKHDMSHINLFTLPEAKIIGDSAAVTKYNDIAKEIYWINCPDATKEKYEEKVEHYRKFLKGKPVYESINRSITFLNKMNYEIRSNSNKK